MSNWRINDEAQGAAHAQDTRFTGVDNSKFVRDPDKLTYGPWRKNVGPPRTIAEATAVYEKITGRKLPPFVKVVVDPNLPSNKAGRYTFNRKADLRAKFEVEQITEGVTVNIRPSVLESDEAIVCVFRHEMYELENLAQMAEEANMTNRDVNAHTTPKVRHNLHDQAWDVADLEVLIMRERPGSPKHAELVERRESLLARFELQNHGSPE